VNELQQAAAAVSSLKAAFDLSKAIIDVGGAVKVQGKVFELQREILAAQSSAMGAQAAQTDLLSEIESLKREINGLKDWSKDAERYELKAIDSGAFAYMLRAGEERGEPPHWLCTTCFGNRQKSILQTKGQVNTVAGGRGMHAKWGCNSCRGEVTVYYRRQPSVPWPEPAADDATSAEGPTA
jgi:hypothetical protein